jgi:hypothetical protein
LLLFTFFSGEMEKFRADAWRTLVDIDKRLHVAAKTLTTLEGLVPVCSYCKKIRPVRSKISV